MAAVCGRKGTGAQKKRPSEAVLIQLSARSVTHAQRMARLLSDAGISAKIRRAGAAITERGCGYTLEIPRRHAARAMQACRAGGVLPVKVLFVSDDGMQEVAL